MVGSRDANTPRSGVPWPGDAALVALRRTFGYHGSEPDRPVADKPTYLPSGPEAGIDSSESIHWKLTLRSTCYRDRTRQGLLKRYGVLDGVGAAERLPRWVGIAGLDRRGRYHPPGGQLDTPWRFLPAARAKRDTRAPPD